MRKRTAKSKTPEQRGRKKKTFEIVQPSLERAQLILNSEHRPRSLTRLIEDLLDAEYDRLFSNKRKVAA